MATRAEITRAKLDKQALWRSYKAAGHTSQEIADALGHSKALVHALTEPAPGERRCPRCCQHLQPEVQLPVKRKK